MQDCQKTFVDTGSGRQRIAVHVIGEVPLLRRAVTELLGRSRLIRVTGDSAGSVATQAAQLADPAHVLVLAATSATGIYEFGVLQGLQQALPHLPVIVVNFLGDDPLAMAFYQKGVAGYVSGIATWQDLAGAVCSVQKTGRYVCPAITEALAQGFSPDGGLPHRRLSRRELEVFLSLVRGYKVSEIADGLQLSVKTVSSFRRRILAKMAMRSNADLTRYAIEHCLR